MGEGTRDGLYCTTIMVKAKYSINIINSKKKICLNLHYIAINRFFVW